MHKLDTRGMSCPQPVLMTKKTLEQNHTELEILVDNETALGNVTRYLMNQGFKDIRSEASGDDRIIHAVK